MASPPPARATSRSGVVSTKARLWVAGAVVAAGLAGAATTLGLLSRSSSAAAPAPAAASSRIPSPELELRRPKFFRSEDSSLYVVGELFNAGERALAAPSAAVTMFDRDRRPLERASCGAEQVRRLLPGSAVPCYGVFSRAEAWATYAVETTVGPMSEARVREAQLHVEARFTPARGGESSRVTGVVLNRSGFSVERVWVFIGLYDREGQIVGAARTTLADLLEVEARASFSVSLYHLGGVPKTSIAHAYGYAR